MGSREQVSTPARPVFRDPVLVACAAGFAAALFLAHVVLAWKMRGPIMADEGSYLLSARFLVDGVAEPRRAYHPGYPLLLVPAELVGSTAWRAYRLSLLTNALLALAVFPLCYGLLRSLTSLATPRVALAASALTTLVPALLVGPTLAISEAAFIPGFIATAWLVVVAAQRRSDLAWWSSAALTGFLVVISPRGLVVVAVFAAVLLLAGRPLAHHVRRIGGSGAAFATVVVAGWLLDRYIPSTQQGTPGAAGGPDDVLRKLWRNLEPGVLWDTIGRFSGRGTYVGAAAAGIALVGLAVAILWAHRAWSAPSPRSIGALFIAVPPVLTWLVDAAWNDEDNPILRVDQLAYGRYIENQIAPVVALGFVVLCSTAGTVGVRRIRQWAVVVVPLVVLGFAAVATVWDPGPVGSATHTHNILSFQVYDDLLGPLAFGKYGLLAAGVSVAVLGAFRFRREAGIVVAAAVLLLSSARAFDGYVLPASERSAVRRGLVSEIAALDAAGLDTGCISYDAPVLGRMLAFENFKVFLPDSELTTFHSTRGELPCGVVVISDRDDLDATFPGARLVAQGSGNNLWLVPERR